MKKKQIAAALLMSMAISTLPIMSVNAVSSGWKVQGSQWYYYNSDGSMKTGWLKDGERWYYLNGNGAMKTGWLKDGGNWYYLKSSGEMAKHWLKVDGAWYYFDESGAMKTGWIELDSNDEIAEGWTGSESFRYYLTSDGSMKTGWLKDGEDWYYLKSNGEAADEWMEINNKWYYFSYGLMKTGWTKTRNHYPEYDAAWYYLSKNGDWVENSKDFYKIELEKKVYDISEKEIKFTAFNDSEFDYYVSPEYSLDVLKDGNWESIEARDDNPIRPVKVKSNSQQALIINVESLHGGELEAGKYRVGTYVDGEGSDFVSAEFEVTGEKAAEDVTMKTDKIIYHIQGKDIDVVIDDKITYSITNNTDKDISFGEDYKIQHLEAGQWKDTDLQPGGFYARERFVKSKDTYKGIISIEDIQGKFEPGTYRIVKEINGQEFYAEFNVQFAYGEICG